MLLVHRFTAHRFAMAGALSMVLACGVTNVEGDELGSVRQRGVDAQGVDAQGVDAQGVDAQGVDAQGVDAQGVDAQGIDMTGNKYDRRAMYFHSQKYAGATWNEKPVCLWLIQGELVAQLAGSRDSQCPLQPPTRDAKTAGLGLITGKDLIGLTVFADEFLPDGTTGLTNFRYRVASIEEEYWSLPASFPVPYNPGRTFLYNLEHELKDGKWVTSCGLDADGRSHAIPTHGTWNSTGTKVASSSYFTFGCTSGVIAKCYRWGYRPWVNASFWDHHAACTRMARADYCGNGYSWTQPGTTLNHWDRMAGTPVSGWDPDPTYNEAGKFFFEAAWDKTGARCLAHYRWYDLPEGFASSQCEEKLRNPKYVPPPGGCKSKDQNDCKPTVCDNETEAVAGWPSVLHFDKSMCNGASGSCP